MQPLAPALEEILEHLEDLDRRLRLRRVDAGAEDVLLQRSDLAEIYVHIDALISSIRSIDTEFRRYRDRFLHHPAACLCTSPDGIVLEENTAAARLFDLPPDRLRGSSLDVHLHPESLPVFRSMVAALARGEDLRRQEFLLRRTDGGAARVAAAVSALRGPGGALIELIWVFQEIPAGREVGEALRRSEDEYRAIAGGQAELIYRWLPDGTVTFANEAYCRYIGIPCRDLVGRRHAPGLVAKDGARARQSLASLTPDHPVSVTERRVVMPEGGVRWQQWTDTAFFDDEGSVVEYQSVGRDITDARAAREALLLANRKLNLLSEVTRHDILNLLSVLMGYLDLSRAQTDDPELQEYFKKEEEAIQGIQRCMAFTGEYQDVGVASPVWQPLSRIIHEAMAGLDPGDIAVEMEADDLEVYADPLIARVFANLIDNSLRHGGNVSRIRIYPEVSDREIKIIYEDDGIGIPHAEKERLFERGFGRKTGFGLFLAREILSITDISIRETGEPGSGVRFEINIPPGFYRFTGPGRAR